MTETRARDPRATVLIQRLPEFVQGNQDAVVARANGDLTAVAGKIEGSSGDEGVIVEAEITLPNIPSNLRKQVDPDGQLEVEAGYAQGDLPVNLIFVGNIQHAVPVRRGGEVDLRLIADVSPSKLSDVHVPAEFKNATIGQMIRSLMEAVGFTIQLPASAFEFEVSETYTTKDSVITEVNRLVNALHYQTGRPHFLAPALPSGGSALTSTNPTPSLSGGGTSFRVVDAGAGQDAVEVLEVTFPEDTVYEAEPIPVRAQASAPLPVTSGNAETLESLQSQTATMEYRMVTPLDPRLGLGLRVEIRDEEAGEEGVMTITSIIHNLREWTTTAQGIYQRMDLP